MKARVKLILGAAFAAIAIMAATVPGPEPGDGKRQESPCYTASEVDLLMRANKWSRQEATAILDMACELSGRVEKAPKN